MKFKVSAVLALLVLFTYSANAAPVSKVVKVVAAKPIATITLSGAAGDQFFGVTTSPESIVYVGTVESGTTTALGLSDGYVSAISPTGTRQWELRLGTALDDIATSILRDKVGNYWVLGATSQPIPPVVIAPPAPSLNPDSATVETTTAPVTFNRALLWKLSNSGALLATYQYDSPQELYPKTLTLGATSLTITGDLADGSSFSLQSDFNGVFTGFAPLTIKSAVAPAITITKAGTYTYKSFISKGAIIGIPTWKPKTPTPVIVEYNKANTLKSAFSLKGNVTNRIWQAGIGLVVISDLGSSTAIYALPLVP